MDDEYAPVTGYTNEFSVAPSETIEFKISSKLPYSAKLVRIVHGDPNPAGPGTKYTEIPSEFEGQYPTRLQETKLGSYGITQVAELALSYPVTIGATIWPTLLSKNLEFQCVLSRQDDSGRGFAIGINANSCMELRVDGSVRLQTGFPMRERTWYHVAAVFARDTLTVWQRALSPEFGANDSVSVSVACDVLGLQSRGAFVIAACQTVNGSISMHFNGKIELPFVCRDTISHQEEEKFRSILHDPSVLALWDFSVGIKTQTATDTGPHKLDAPLVNLPTRAMKGSSWTGREMCFRHAPSEYGAIHFHEDDIYDCNWETSFTFTVPADFPSGVYGAKLESAEASDIIPFYVRPILGKPTAKVAFLASTFTYQIYANHVRGNSDEDYFKRAKAWGACLSHPDQYYYRYGASTYNRHSDGSGICYSSRLRPILTMRPGFLTFNDPRGSGLRHFPADTHILDWLDRHDIQFDVLTDEDLSRDGLSLLKPYNVVLTGSHPEYHTLGTLDSLQNYTESGGRLMYLGGNGFYWRIAQSSTLPGALEIRRGEGGIRSWNSEPGEYYNCLEGSYGGLWRRNDRPPQRLVGVGFSSQGMFEGSYYVRTNDSHSNPRVSWIFENVNDNVLGNFGLSGGGAAGFELDRADRRLGTPSNCVILATSAGHSNLTFIPVHEEMLTHDSTVSGEEPDELIHADVVFFETAGGGAVFSSASITFCGSLSYNNYNNNISQMVLNVLRRFMQDGKLPG